MKKKNDLYLFDTIYFISFSSMSSCKAWDAGVSTLVTVSRPAIFAVNFFFLHGFRISDFLVALQHVPSLFYFGYFVTPPERPKYLPDLAKHQLSANRPKRGDGIVLSILLIVAFNPNMLLRKLYKPIVITSLHPFLRYPNTSAYHQLSVLLRVLNHN